jgi:hypothetical protein
MQKKINWDLNRRSGEKIIWEGRPDQGLYFGVEMIAVAIFCSVLLLFSFVFAYALVDQTNLFWIINVSGFILAVLITVLYPILDMIGRRKAYYALTNQRALQAGSMSKKIKSVPIEGWNYLELTKSRRPSITYYRSQTPLSKLRHSGKSSRPTYIAGFWRIEDAAKVFEMMKEMKERELAIPSFNAV